MLSVSRLGLFNHAVTCSLQLLGKFSSRILLEICNKQQTVVEVGARGKFSSRILLEICNKQQTQVKLGAKLPALGEFSKESQLEADTSLFIIPDLITRFKTC